MCFLNICFTIFMISSSCVYSMTLSMSNNVLEKIKASVIK